jgi:hypothetical protein
MSTPTRYRILVHEIDDSHTVTIMDETANAFIAATAIPTPTGELDIALGEGGPRSQVNEIAHLVTSQYPA